MRRGEAGYSLVFAVATLAAFGLLVAAMLSLSASVALQTRAATEITRGRNAADASVEFGIDRIVEDAAAATFADQATFQVPGRVDGELVDVTVKNVSVTYITICLPGESPPCPPSPTQDGAPRTFPGARNTNHDFTAYVLSGVAIPFSPVWSVSPSTGATVTQAGCFGAIASGTYTVATISQAGRFCAIAPGTYTVKIDVNNVSATVTVTVP